MIDFPGFNNYTFFLKRNDALTIWIEIDKNLFWSRRKSQKGFFVVFMLFPIDFPIDKNSLIKDSYFTANFRIPKYGALLK